jgi:thioredoxin reductase
MTVTVDVVVVGSNQRALDAAVESAQDGKRVLVIAVTRSAELRSRVRRARLAMGPAQSERISVLTGARVECIAGIRTVEAVLARDVRTGRRIDINASALLMFEDEPQARTAEHLKES